VSPSAYRLRKIGLLVAVGAITALSVLYFTSDDDAAAPVPEPARAAAKPEAATPSPDDPAGENVPSQSQMDTVARLLGDARRLAAEGQVDQAKSAVDQAAKVIPGSADIAKARLDIEQMSSPPYRLAVQLSRARLAIAQDDRTAAEAALNAAAGIDPTAPQIAELRQQMESTAQKEDQRKRRVAALLSEMREAIARRDLVAADRALNEAERLDIRDPAIDPARLELAHAQEDSARSRQQ
jgi:hypothetical protein